MDQAKIVSFGLVLSLLTVVKSEAGKITQEAMQMINQQSKQLDCWVRACIKHQDK